MFRKRMVYRNATWVRIKEKHSQNKKYVWCSRYLQTELFGASFIKIHKEMRKLSEFLAFVIVNMGTAILNI